MAMTNYEAGGNSGAEQLGASATGVAEHNAADEQGQEQTQQSTTEGSTDQQSQSQSQEQQPTWDGAQYTLKFRGNQVVPKTRDELVNWAQLGYSYNNRKQQLDKREQELQQIDENIKQAMQINQLFDQVPEFKRQIYDLYSKFQSGQSTQQQTQQQPAEETFEGESALKAEIARLREDLSHVQNRTKAMDEKEAVAAIAKEIESVKTKYADEDWVTKDEAGHDLMYEVLSHAHQRRFPDLDSAYKDLRWEIRENNLKAKALKEYEEKQQQAAKAGFVGKGGGTRPVEPPVKAEPNYRKMSYSQLAAEAAKNMKD